MSLQNTKIAAALRLITAAIRLDEEGHDQMATLVVAACALNMIRELLKKRGASFESRCARMTVYLEAEKVRQGYKISRYYSEMEETVNTFASLIESGYLKHYMDIEVNLKKSDEIEFLSSVYRPYNFLKHADRDFDKILAEDCLDAKDAIVLAVIAYSMLFPSEIPPEPLPAFLDLYRIVNKEHSDSDIEKMIELRNSGDSITI